MDVFLPIFYDTFRGREKWFFFGGTSISFFGSSTGVKPPLLWQADSLFFYPPGKRGCCPFGGVFNITKSDGDPPVFEILYLFTPTFFGKKNDHFDFDQFFFQIWVVPKFTTTPNSFFNHFKSCISKIPHFQSLEVSSTFRWFQAVVGWRATGGQVSWAHRIISYTPRFGQRMTSQPTLPPNVAPFRNSRV